MRRLPHQAITAPTMTISRASGAIPVRYARAGADTTRLGSSATTIQGVPGTGAALARIVSPRS